MRIELRVVDLRVDPQREVLLHLRRRHRHALPLSFLLRRRRRTVDVAAQVLRYHIRDVVDVRATTPRVDRVHEGAVAEAVLRERRDNLPRYARIGIIDSLAAELRGHVRARRGFLILLLLLLARQGVRPHPAAHLGVLLERVHGDLLPVDVDAERLRALCSATPLLRKDVRRPCHIVNPRHKDGVNRIIDPIGHCKVLEVGVECDFDVV